jgi:protein-S-isoprenylcysteine O-methyltransferase Ste14
MIIAKVQLIRKLVLGVVIAGVIAAFAVTASSHPEGEVTHETIEWVGILMMVVCIAGRSWASLYIGGRKITEFVTLGPYSVMRNPLYFFSILGAVGAGAQLGSIYAGLFCGIVVWAVFAVVVRSEERLMSRLYGAEFEAYKHRVWRFIPNPRLWRDVPTMLVMPSRALRTFGDGMFLLLSVPLAECIERLQHVGVLPILFHIN